MLTDKNLFLGSTVFRWFRFNFSVKTTRIRQNLSLVVLACMRTLFRSVRELQAQFFQDRLKYGGLPQRSQAILDGHERQTRLFRAIGTLQPLDRFLILPHTRIDHSNLERTMTNTRVHLFKLPCNCLSLLP